MTASTHRVCFDFRTPSRYQVICSCGFFGETETYIAAEAAADRHRRTVGAPVPASRLLDLEAMLDQARRPLDDASRFAERCGLEELERFVSGALEVLEGVSEPLGALYREAVEREVTEAYEAGFLR